MSISDSPLPSSFYEIELKALLSPDQYARLEGELPKRCRMINEDTIHTTRYRPGDIRLRHSPKICEIICKDGDPTKVCRKEVCIPLESRDLLGYYAQTFGLLNLRADPPWTKYKREFSYEYNGFTYVVCLQDIQHFARILEVECISDTDTSSIHEPNLQAIITDLGCEPIDPKDFSNRIKEYIQRNRPSAR